MRHSLVAAFALLLSSALTVIPEAPRVLSFAAFTLVFVGIFGYALWTHSSLSVTARPGILIGAIAVWLALLVGLARSPTVGGILRVGAFVVFSGAALFVLPSVVPRRAAYRALALIAAGFGVLGIITAIVGPSGPLGVYRQASIVGVDYFIPLSLFKNPNMLANVSLLGALAAGGIAFTRQPGDTFSNRGSAAILGGLCTLVVVISGSRASLLALLAGGGVLVVADRTTPRTTAIVTLGGLAAVVAAILAAAAVGISFSGRFDLWAAALEATAERPLFGWGPGASADVLRSFLPSGSRYAGFSTHNSYLRMFFIGGVIGGIGYLLLSVSALRTALTPPDPTTLALVVAALVFFIFETGTVFGIAPMSFVSALAIGYAQQGADPITPLSTSSSTWQWDIPSRLP